MRQKGTPDPGRILKSKKCCDAQQLPNGFRPGVGIGGHSIGCHFRGLQTFSHVRFVPKAGIGCRERQLLSYWASAA